ncbi:MAG: aminotransferase class IV, partial [Bacteroidota bacterium]
RPVLQTFDDRNRDLLVNINGDLVHRDQAGISPFDSLVQGGDGVWEGLRLYDGKIFRLDEHLRRLHDSARIIAIQNIPSRDAIVEEVRRTLEANGMTDGVHIRLTLSRGTKITSGMDPRLNQSGPTLIVLAEYKAPVYGKTGLTLATASVRRFPPDCLDPKIHSNNLLQSILAKIEATASGADAALLLDREGFIAECNGTHVFLVRDGAVLTSHTDACPEGITRQTVLDLCEANGIPHRVGRYSLAEAYRADEMFCTGTMGELAAVTTLDGRTIGSGEVGPMTRRLTDLFTAEVKASGVRVVEA